MIAAQERGAGLTVCVKCWGIVVLAFSSSDESAWDWDFLEEDTVSSLAKLEDECDSLPIKHQHGT